MITWPQRQRPYSCLTITCELTIDVNCHVLVTRGEVLWAFWLFQLIKYNFDKLLLKRLLRTFSFSVQYMGWTFIVFLVPRNHFGCSAWKFDSGFQLNMIEVILFGNFNQINRKLILIELHLVELSNDLLKNKRLIQAAVTGESIRYQNWKDVGVLTTRRVAWHESAACGCFMPTNYDTTATLTS